MSLSTGGRARFTLKPTTPAPTGRHDDCGAAFWPTPLAVVRALLDDHPPPAGCWVVEPSAGTGAIAVELAARGHLVEAVEIRQECRMPLEHHLSDNQCHRVTICDWMRWSPPQYIDFAIVGNPPYNPAGEMLGHVRKALEHDPLYCAMLLPLNFLCGIERVRLLVARPPAYVRPLVPRPAFKASGEGGMRDVAWFVWIRGDCSAQVRPLLWKEKR